MLKLILLLQSLQELRIALYITIKSKFKLLYENQSLLLYVLGNIVFEEFTGDLEGEEQMAEGAHHLMLLFHYAETYLQAKLFQEKWRFQNLGVENLKM